MKQRRRSCVPGPRETVRPGEATRRLVTPALMAVIAVGAALACSSPEPAREPASTAAQDGSAAAVAPAPWYDRTRTLDLTGDGEADSVRLRATGESPDSLRIALVLLVGGEEKHREAWESGYELALLDSARRSRPRVDSVLRARLDSVLASVAVEPLDARDSRLMPEDSAILAGIEPRPTQEISFSYGYETTSRLFWDAPRKRFVQLWSCC